MGAYLSLSLRGTEVGWVLIRGWALIKFFCFQDGCLFEVGAYSNKYGIGFYFLSCKENYLSQCTTVLATMLPSLNLH